MLIILSVVGLAFKQTSDSVVLFVVTTEAVLSYNTSAKDKRVSVEKASPSCTLLLSIITKCTRNTCFLFGYVKYSSTTSTTTYSKMFEFNITMLDTSYWLLEAS